jgi:hypothetical protein
MADPTTTTTPATMRENIYNGFSKAGTYIYKVSSIIKLTILLITIGTIVIIVWIFNQADLLSKACKNLENPGKTNVSYFSGRNNISSDAIENFDNPTYSKLINYHVKSAYNCCCGDGYKNNFVALCALEYCIANGCRFLDFEIYSYNNDPIIASSTASDNFIKETYNALLLSDVLTIIIEQAFDANKTTCANDPLILNFRVKSTNITMLEKMGDLLEQYLGSTNGDFGLLRNYRPADLLQVQMKNLFKKIIIICTFYPSSNILLNSKLLKLKNLINLDGKGEHCNTLRTNEVIDTKSAEFINSARTKYIIILPQLNNSITNFDSSSFLVAGCQAICMKHQTKEAATDAEGTLTLYNNRFNAENNKNYSWKLKPTGIRQLSTLPPNTDPTTTTTTTTTTTSVLGTPTATLTASIYTIASGSSTTITPTFTNGARVTINRNTMLNGVNIINSNNTAITVSPTITTQYTLDVTNSIGAVASSSVTINVPDEYTST